MAMRVSPLLLGAMTFAARVRDPCSDWRRAHCASAWPVTVWSSCPGMGRNQPIARRMPATGGDHSSGLGRHHTLWEIP